MRFTPTPLPGAFEVDLDRLGDERGWFARSFDANEFAAHAIELEVVQTNASFNAACDTLRGLHYQADPHGEAKLVRCVAGEIFDVAVDLRPDSPTYRGWHGVHLSSESRRAFFIPPGLAHGFQTLTQDTELLYLMGHRHVPEAARGVRWDDPAFAIAWPAPHGERTISDRDSAWPDFIS